MNRDKMRLNARAQGDKAAKTIPRIINHAPTFGRGTTVNPLRNPHTAVTNARALLR